MSNSEPFNLSLRASNGSMVKGCPGVQRSFPRIEGILEVRSNNGLPVVIRKVLVTLVNAQEITVPSSSGIGSNSLSRSFDLFTYTVYAGSQDALGMDIPFIVPIPQDIIASGEIPKFSMVNKTLLRFNITYGNKVVADSVHEYPIPVKKYNTLPIYRQFNNLGTKTVDSPDRLVLLDYSIPRLCVGPGDNTEFVLKVSLNAHHHKKVKLKKLYLELREVVEFHDGGFQDKITKIANTQTEFTSTDVSREGKSFKLEFKVPVETPWNEMTSVDEQENVPIRSIKSLKTLGKFNTNVPLSHAQGFTNIGKLFSVRYELYLKIKFSHAKDLELKQQLIVSPINTASSYNVLKWIMQECDLASLIFGSNFDSNMDTTLKRAYSLSSDKLKVYKSSSVDDWVRLGLGERLVRTQGKVLDYYID